LVFVAMSVVGAAVAHAPGGRTKPAGVEGTLVGKVCTTAGGATFTFARDGHYAYDGMWTDTGHYTLHEGAVTILLDSGLERDFAVSRRDGVLYLEQTAVRCAPAGAAALNGVPPGRLREAPRRARP